MLRSSSPLTKPETWKTPEITAYLGEVSHKIVTGFHKLGSHRQDSVRRVGEVIRTSIESKKIGLPLVQDLCGILREHPALIVEYVEKWLPKTQRLELSEEFARLGLFRFSVAPDTPLEWRAAIGVEAHKRKAQDSRVLLLVRYILIHPEYESAVTTLASEDARRTQEILQDLFYSNSTWRDLSAAGQREYHVPFNDDWRRTRLPRIISRLFISSEILPSTLVIDTSHLTYVKREFRSTMLTDCHRATLGNREVVLKNLVLRRSEIDNHEAEKVVTRVAEVLVRQLLRWRQLRHENIMPLVGVIAEFSAPTLFEKGSPSLTIITPYMHNGNILDHARNLRTEHRAIPFGDWLLQLTNSLLYLHEQGIVHGNLCCNQIFVEDDGKLRLSDFDMPILGVLSRQITEASAGRRPRHILYWADRYMAPELLPADEDVPNVLTSLDIAITSPAADIYALASTIVELYSGMPPYFKPTDKPKYTSQWDVRDWVKGGIRPLRPIEVAIAPIPDPLWDLMQRCWLQNPEDRPTLEQVRTWLVGIFGTP